MPGNLVAQLFSNTGRSPARPTQPHTPDELTASTTKVTGQRVERSIDRRIQTTSAAWGGSRMFRFVADGINGPGWEPFETRVVDERRRQHEAALRPAHPEQPPPDEWLFRWKVRLPLLHGRKDAKRFGA